MSINNTSSSVIALSKSQRFKVQAGCVCLMIATSMVWLSLATIQAPILQKMDAMKYFSLLTIFSSLGISIMTPIGGKLSDLIGRKNIIIIAGSISAICVIGLGIVHSIIPFMILRLLLGAAQGTFLSTPYILAREINEPKDVPKIMGLLSSSIALGGFMGSIISGVLTDMGYLTLAIIFPALLLIIGLALIGINLPNHKREGKVDIDVKGIIFLAIALSGILLALNYGPKMGWFDIKIIIGFIIGIIALIIFIQIEKKATEPIIPLHLFKNKKYNVLLLIGFICYFYMNGVYAYAPLAVRDVLGQSTSTAGSLQLPRTIITLILPIFAGAWVGKSTKNIWKAMGIGTLFVALPLLAMSFTSQNTNVLLYFVAITITGIAESFRSVSITPAAQSTLERQDLGVGTSLVNFVNTLSGLVAAAVFGVAYDINTKANPADVNNIIAGINSIFLISAIVSFLGFMIAIFVLRKLMEVKE